MPQPTTKPSRIRDRQMKRRTKGQRANALLNRADNARAGLVAQELAVAQLRAQPEDARTEGYEDALTNAERELDVAQAKADALYTEAELVLGRKIAAKDRRERDKAVLRTQAELIEQNLDAWEGTLLDHEANLVELDAVPAAARDEAWERDHASNVAAIETIERALDAGETKLAEVKGDPAFDADAPAPAELLTTEEQAAKDAAAAEAAAKADAAKPAKG